MADINAILEKVRKKVKNKKAKLKDMPEEPTGTKSKKLDSKMAAAFKEAYGGNVANVQVHTGGNIADIAKNLRVRAFSHGPHIYLAKPSDANDQMLLAHELAHVLNQGGGKIKTPQKKKALVSK